MAASSAVMADDSIVNVIDTPIEVNPGFRQVNHEKSSAPGWIGFGLGIFALAGVAYSLSQIKRIDIITRNAARKIQGNDDSLTKIDKSVADLRSRVDILDAENARLKELLQLYISELSRKVSAQVETKPVNSGIPKTSPAPPAVNSPAPSDEVFYATSLSQDDYGNYVIPARMLEKDNTRAMFMVLIDPMTGNGTYQLNPGATDIADNLDSLRNYADGVVAGKTAYETKSPGTIEREGRYYRITRKLTVG